MSESLSENKADQCMVDYPKVIPLFEIDVILGFTKPYRLQDEGEEQLMMKESANEIDPNTKLLSSGVEPHIFGKGVDNFSTRTSIWTRRQGIV